MTMVRQELRRGRMQLAIWTASVGALLAVCVLLFPEMKGEMEQVSGIFASMGSFTKAFGMDRLDFGTLIGFYGVECGNVLGLGGAFFASLLGIAALSSEESGHTAEFLLTHPVTRARVLAEKLAAVLIEVLVFNAVNALIAVGCIRLIGEPLPGKEILLLHEAYLAMQVELAMICFGLSAFLRRGALGVGLGLATVMYFLNLVANIADSASWLKYVTPFGYTESADIVSAGRLDMGMLALGLVVGVLVAAAGSAYYARKDIQ